MTDRANDQQQRLRLESLSDESRYALLDEFLTLLDPFLREGRELEKVLGPREKKGWSKAKLMKEVARRWKESLLGGNTPEERHGVNGSPEGGTPRADHEGETPKATWLSREEVKKIEEATLDSRYFDRLVKLAYERSLIHLTPRRHTDFESKLRDQFKPVGVVVVGGKSSRHFFQVAAGQFVKEIARVGSEVSGQGREVLNVGLVSGSTVAGVIGAAIKADDWMQTFGIRPSEFPKIQVFALNVCLTKPEHLDGNATILAHRVAGKINEQCPDERAEACGLSAPLIVLKSQLQRYDSLPHTRDVLAVTDPERLKRSGQSSGHDETTTPAAVETQLDIVLTSVGQRTQPTSSDAGSIFYQLAEYAREFLAQPDFDIDEIAQSRDMQGDLVYTPIDRDGMEIPIPVEITEKGEVWADKLLFYSAIRLPVLESMARVSEKSVILVARHAEGKDKSIAIAAALTQHRYASQLVVDEATAQKLLRP